MARPLHLPKFFEEEDFSLLYKIHGQKKYGLRLLALRYIQQGRSVKDSAALLFKTEYTIREWIRSYAERGIEDLLSISPGRGRNTKLLPSDEIRLKEEITRLTNSLKGGRLRAADIRELIQSKFKVNYGLSGIYPLLHRLGYSWITARSIDPQASKDLQESFKK